MIIFVTPDNRHRFGKQLESYFKLRKQVFCDKLNWVESRDGSREMDRFDHLFNVYILAIDEQSGKLGGGVRLMPTTGPTLLHSTWPDLLNHPDEFREKGIWEATRFCVDEGQSSRKANLLNRSTVLLSLAIAEFGRVNGISHVVGVCEKYFFDMSGAFGPKPELISSKTDENGLEIGLGLWSLEQMGKTVGWSKALIGDVEPAIINQAA